MEFERIVEGIFFYVVFFVDVCFELYCMRSLINALMAKYVLNNNF